MPFVCFTFWLSRLLLLFLFLFVCSAFYVTLLLFHGRCIPFFRDFSLFFFYFNFHVTFVYGKMYMLPLKCEIR